MIFAKIYSFYTSMNANVTESKINLSNLFWEPVKKEI